jgi:glycerol-3-phosphate dehydrogenase
MKDAEGYVNGVMARDQLTGEELAIPARVVVNATGAFTDSVRRMADASVEPMMVTSQGIHLVFDRSFLKGDTALMVPRTSDGRVLFVIPWHGHAVAGTTDTPVDAPSLEPRPFDEEIEFVLETAGRYFTRPPSRKDVLAVYTGLRPLVRSDSKGEGKTAALSRDHVIHVDASGLLTITGGKWTTYRHMAEDCVDHAITLGRLQDLDCATKHLKIHGYAAEPVGLGSVDEHFAVYGADAVELEELAREPGLAERLHPDLPYIAAEVVWAARNEMAQAVEDVLARRTRALFLNANAARAMAEPVARLLAQELGHDEVWVRAQISEFLALSEKYRVV